MKSNHCNGNEERKRWKNAKEEKKIMIERKGEKEKEMRRNKRKRWEENGEENMLMRGRKKCKWEKGRKKKEGKKGSNFDTCWLNDDEKS